MKPLPFPKYLIVDTHNGIYNLKNIYNEKNELNHVN